ncbi:MAG: ABC transporter substrate-binding protein [Bacillota bacterium]
MTRTHLRLGSIFTAAALTAFLAGCATQPTATPPTGQTPGITKTKVGIVQFAEHPALDSVRKGFIDTLNEKGLTDKVTIDYKNAQGEMTTAQSIAQKMVGDKDDLILAIATPAAQAVAKATTTIPTLITAVTDPVSAGLAKSMEQPGGNITGTTDMNPVAKQLELVKQLSPSAKKIGIPYNAGETNALVQVKIARQAASNLGLELVEVTVTNTNDVAQAVQSLVGRVDALYIPSDNTVVSAFASVLKVAEKAKLPTICAGSDIVQQGGLATWGIDYYQLGRQTGEMAIRIINGQKPAVMPIESLKDVRLVINKAAAEKIGLTIPTPLLQQAEVISK